MYRIALYWICLESQFKPFTLKSFFPLTFLNIWKKFNLEANQIQDTGFEGRAMWNATLGVKFDSLRLYICSVITWQGN